MPGKPADRSIDFTRMFQIWSWYQEGSRRAGDGGQRSRAAKRLSRFGFSPRVFSSVAPLMPHAGLRQQRTYASPYPDGMTGSQALTLLQGLSLPVHRNGSSGSIFGALFLVPYRIKDSAGLDLGLAGLLVS